MKVSFRLSAIVIFLSIFIAFACKKGEDCKTCKALNFNGTVKAEETVCNEDEEQAFRHKFPDNEVVCNK
jgi:hypothetical protein